VLAAELAGGIEIPAALAGYDLLRRPRSQQVQRAARQDPKISLPTNPFTYASSAWHAPWARNGVVAWAASPSKATRPST
jgi:hypothetical protein